MKKLLFQLFNKKEHAKNEKIVTCVILDGRVSARKTLTFCYTLFLPFFFVFPFLNSNIKKCQLFATTSP